MKVLARMIAAIIYFAVIICVWKIAYKDGKQHGESAEKIASKAREKEAYEKGRKDERTAERYIPQETYNIVPVHAAFELPLCGNGKEIEEQRAWAYRKLTELIGEEITQYIKFYDCENLPYCRRTYKAQLRVVDERNCFVERGSRNGVKNAD